MTCPHHADVYPRWEPPAGSTLLGVDERDRLHYVTAHGIGFCELIGGPS